MVQGPIRSNIEVLMENQADKQMEDYMETVIVRFIGIVLGLGVRVQGLGLRVRGFRHRIESFDQKLQMTASTSRSTPPKTIPLILSTQSDKPCMQYRRESKLRRHARLLKIRVP